MSAVRVKLIDSVLQGPASGNNNPFVCKGVPEETNVDNLNNRIEVERPTGNSRAAGLRGLRTD